MSEEQAKALVEKVTTDDEFRQRLEATPIEERRSVLVDAGYGDVKLRHMSAVLPESAGGELSDDEFEAVAGGLGVLPESISWQHVPTAVAAAAY